MQGRPVWQPQDNPAENKLRDFLRQRWKNRF